ncbi:MAG: hypothetical protein DCF15_19925, partial [Phormidesmis priestleyi]
KLLLLSIFIIYLSMRNSYPRAHQWPSHFAWSQNCLTIVGISAIGRATCKRLDVNDNEHDEGAIVRARRLWIKGGWHRPVGDPIQK